MLIRDDILKKLPSFLQGEYTFKPTSIVDGISSANVLLSEAVFHCSVLLLVALLPRVVLPTSQKGGHSAARSPRDCRTVLHIFGLFLQVRLHNNAL